MNETTMSAAQSPTTRQGWRALLLARDPGERLNAISSSLLQKRRTSLLMMDILPINKRKRMLNRL
jgi:hypothetical protein